MNPTVMTGDTYILHISWRGKIFSQLKAETSSLFLMEEHRLRLFENRVLRRIFGLERVKIIERMRKLHSGEHHDFCSSPGIIEIMKSNREILARM